MLLSIVSNTSNCFSASMRSAPFFRPAQPISGTDFTSCPGKSRLSRQSRFSSRRIFTSGWLEKLFARLFQDPNDLRAFHAWETFEEIVNRIAGLQVIEQALHRNACANEHRCAAKDIRIGLDDGLCFHGGMLSRIAGRLKFQK